MLQTFTDKLAISLSMLCAVHCLAFPIAMVWLPSIAALQLDGESFHFWMLIAVLPTSIYALTMGCLQHKRYELLAIGFVGLSLLVSAILLEEIVGESGEKLLTVLGATLIAIGHYRNFRLCRSHTHQQGCDCLNHPDETI